MVSFSLSLFNVLTILIFFSFWLTITTSVLVPLYCCMCCTEYFSSGDMNTLEFADGIEYIIQLDLGDQGYISKVERQKEQETALRVLLPRGRDKAGRSV